MKAPFNPIAVANYLVQKSLNDGVELTPMKVVKLVYIAHGWYLALTNGPLLTHAVQAWKYGPVVPNVYHAFKKYANSQILGLEGDPNTGKIFEVDEDEDKAFLDRIWEVHKKYSGVDLSSLTHKEGTPWDQVWNDGGGSSKKFVVIPNNIIQAYYLKKNNGAAKHA